MMEEPGQKRNSATECAAPVHEFQEELVVDRLEVGLQVDVHHVDPATVSDLVAINRAIFTPALATPLCDGNNDGRCNVSDIVAER